MQKLQHIVTRVDICYTTGVEAARVDSRGSIFRDFVAGKSLIAFAASILIHFIHKSALAILDIKMPEMDGFELYRKLRKIDNKLKICFLTAAELSHYRETDSDIMDELGNNYFVAKPVDTIDLIDRLKVMLSQR